jgi:hypothetical protein
MRTVRPITAVLAAILGAVLLAGCDIATSAGASPLDTSGFTARPVDSFGEPIESTGPKGSGTPGIAGFEGWKLINAADVDIGQTESGLAMTLTKRALWFQTSKGVLFYTLVSGDFRITATVQTSKTSDSSVDPGGDGTTQLAGLMARGQTPDENYVFVAVGSDANGLSVETKSTTHNDSKFAGPAWPSGDAELKVCRIGPTFTLWKRAIDSGDDFSLAATYKREDLTGEVQVGANIYSDSAPDITALFDNLTIEPLDPGEAC